MCKVHDFASLIVECKSYIFRLAESWDISYHAHCYFSGDDVRLMAFTLDQFDDTLNQLKLSDGDEIFVEKDSRLVNYRTLVSYYILQFYIGVMHV